ncbi:MAG TPA: SHOCT domain-containing protein [Kribbella sp.]|nr:SHOCT domain-containing protein [Kribbella sp.]
MVVVAVRVIGGGIRADDHTRATGRRRAGRARELLDERYAAGELTDDEYREQLTALEERP